MGLSNEQIIALVSRGGSKACLVLVDLLESGEDYPGSIEDVEAMTDDYSSFVFAYPVASVAWAYLEAHKAARYDGDDPLIAKLIESTLDGSLFGKAYE